MINVYITQAGAAGMLATAAESVLLVEFSGKASGSESGNKGSGGVCAAAAHLPLALIAIAPFFLRHKPGA